MPFDRNETGPRPRSLSLLLSHTQTVVLLPSLSLPLPPSLSLSLPPSRPPQRQRLERIAEAARPALAAAFGDQPDAPLYPPRVLDVGAGTGCLIPPLLRVAGSERRRREAAAAGEGGAGGHLASSSPLPMDYLAVDVSSGMLDALERIHGAAGQGAGGERGGGEGEERDPSLVLGNLPRIRTWLGDVESVPQFQAPFDACLFNAVFGNVHDQRSSLLAAALLLRPGSGRVVVAHPMGRGWHERLRAADAEIVPHALPQNAEKWAELLRGLPLELVDAAAERGEGRGAEAAAAAAAAAAAEGAAGAAAARDGRGGSPPPPPSSPSPAAASAPSASSSPRLVIDDEDCYIAVLRVPPARRLPASLYGTSPPPASASPCSAAAGGGGGGGGGGEEGSGGAKQPSLPQLLPQLLPRLPWQERAERGEDGGGGSDRGPRPPPPSPLPPLLLGGTVVKGFGRGSARMGVPTANIDPSPLEEALSGVPDGVYFGWARLLPEESDDPGAGAGRGAEEGGGGGAEGRDGRAHKCVLNIGRRPTFDGENKGVGVLSVEVHVLHEFEEGGKKKEKGEGEGGGGQQQLVDFCGRELRVVATGFIRPEMRFAGIQALVSRIRSDVAMASAALEEEDHAWAKGHGYLWRKKEGE